MCRVIMMPFSRSMAVNRGSAVQAAGCEDSALTFQVSKRRPLISRLSLLQQPRSRRNQ